MKFSSFKNIAEAKPKYYHSVIQGTASALRCEVLGCCSQGRLPSLFPNIVLTTGPHPLATAVTKLWQLCTHTITNTSKPEQLKHSKTDLSTWS
jgi:hypothetical protein